MLELIRKINSQDIDEIDGIVELFEENEVEVYDGHFGDSRMTNLILIKEVSNGYTVAATDAVNNLVLISIRDNELNFFNGKIFGTVIGDKVEGWCFDREGTIAFGYESTQRYAEKAS